MEKILFVDIDGVLNHEAWFRTRGRFDFQNGEDPGDFYERYLRHSMDPACVRRLARVVELSHAEIVLSSSWRRNEQWARTERVFQSMGVGARMLGRTPTPEERDPQVFRRFRQRLPMADEPCPRGYEIQQWLDAHPTRDVRVIAILDDDPDMEHLAHRLVRTNYQTGGLQAAHVQRALRLLGP